MAPGPVALGKAEDGIAISGNEDLVATGDTASYWKNASVLLGSACGGTLIGPRVILTAAHCVTGGTRYPTMCANQNQWLSSFTASFGAQIASEGMRSGNDVEVLSAVCDEGQRPYDLAVVRLLTNVPTAWKVKPVHPWSHNTAEDCLSTFGTGTDAAYYSGYANSSVRKFNWSTDAATFSGYGSSYSSTWGIGSPYHGPEQGDSGGPLFLPPGGGRSEPFLCGVLSAKAEALGSATAIWSDTTRNASNRSFIRDAAQDKFHNWLGECGNGPQTDRDGDGIPDACDLCPDTFESNPQVDSDGDGRGDACDTCVNVPDPEQQNSNAAAEVEPGHSYVDQAARGDRCEPNPLTRFRQTQSRYTPPSSKDPTFRRIYRDPDYDQINWTLRGCRGNAPSRFAEVPARDNTFYVDGVYGAAQVKRGLTRVLHCACPEGVSELNCKDPAYGCGYAGDLANGSAWRGTSVDDARDPVQFANTSGYGNLLSIAGPNGHFYAQTQHKQWDVLTVNTQQVWGWGYWRPGQVDGLVDPALLAQQGVLVNRAFDGLLWTYVRSFVNGSQAYPTPSSPETSQSKDLRNIRKRIAIVEDVRGKPARCAPRWDRFQWANFETCPECGPRLLARMVDEIVNPQAESLDITPGTPGTNGIAGVYPAVAALYESNDYSANWSREHVGRVRGVGFHHSPYRPAGFILAPTASYPLYDFQWNFSGELSPVNAVSGKRQELAAFSGASAAHPLGSVRTFDFDTLEDLEHDIIGDETLTNPVVAVYRVEDDAYYLLDQLPDRVRVYRLGRGYSMRLVANWARSGLYTGYGLTLDEAGNLVTSSWGPDNHAVVHWKYGQRGQPRAEVKATAVVKGTGRDFAAPAVLHHNRLMWAKRVGEDVIGESKIVTFGTPSATNCF